MAALALAGGRGGSGYERFALRAVGLAGLLAVLSIAANFSALEVDTGGNELALEDYDPVAVLMAE